MVKTNYGRVLVLITFLYLFTFVIINSIIISGVMLENVPRNSPPVNSTSLNNSGQATATGSTGAVKTVEYWDKFFGIWDKLFKIFAIIIGAVWAYFRFVKGRVYRPRLELEVKAEAVMLEDATYVTASLQIKNVGLSIVKLRKESIILRVSKGNALARQTKIRRLKWEPIKAYRVFEPHGWVESSETIRDQVMIQLPPSEQQPLLLQLRVVGSIASFFQEKSFEWCEYKAIGPFSKEMVKLADATDKKSSKSNP